MIKTKGDPLDYLHIGDGAQRRVIAGLIPHPVTGKMISVPRGPEVAAELTRNLRPAFREAALTPPNREQPKN